MTLRNTVCVCLLLCIHMYVYVFAMSVCMSLCVCVRVCVRVLSCKRTQVVLAAVQESLCYFEFLEAPRGACALDQRWRVPNEASARATRKESCLESPGTRTEAKTMAQKPVQVCTLYTIYCLYT